MLVKKPKLNVPITITDTESGKEWDFWVYFNHDGKIYLAFDIPDSIKIKQGIMPRRQDFKNEINKKQENAPAV